MSQAYQLVANVGPGLVAGVHITNLSCVHRTHLSGIQGLVCNANISWTLSLSARRLSGGKLSGGEVVRGEVVRGELVRGEVVLGESVKGELVC